MVVSLLVGSLALQRAAATEVLYRALSALDGDGVRQAVRAGADLRGSSKSYGEPPLFYALRWPEMFDLVRRLGAPVTGVDPFGRTLLHCLVSNHSTFISNAPASKGQPVFLNFIGPDETYGSWDWREKVAADLVQHGVRLDAKDVRGRTALHYAVQSGWRGVDILLRMSEGPGSPFTRSVILKGNDWHNRKPILDVRDAKGETPFMLLAKQKGLPIEEIALIAGRLIEAGANIDLRDEDGFSVEDLAAKSGNTFLTSLIKAKREELEGP